MSSGLISTCTTNFDPLTSWVTKKASYETLRRRSMSLQQQEHSKGKPSFLYANRLGCNQLEHLTQVAKVSTGANSILWVSLPCTQNEVYAKARRLGLADESLLTHYSSQFVAVHAYAKS